MIPQTITFESLLKLVEIAKPLGWVSKGGDPEDATNPGRLRELTTRRDMCPICGALSILNDAGQLPTKANWYPYRIEAWSAIEEALGREMTQEENDAVSLFTKLADGGSYAVRTNLEKRKAIEGVLGL